MLLICRVHSNPSLRLSAFSPGQFSPHHPQIIILASPFSHHIIHQYDVCQYDVCRFFELSDRRRWGTLTG